MKQVLALCLFAAGCGGPPEPDARTEQDLYAAIARSDVRYALLTRSEKLVEVQNASGQAVRYAGVEAIDDVAATLSKEHIEHHVQEQRVATMPD